MWNQMRMSPTDLADLSGATLTYLMNGVTPAGNWTGLFRAGERCACASSTAQATRSTTCAFPA
jgi:FtsP/CotA-like multicopper oxidase with cupredoxin domain